MRKLYEQARLHLTTFPTNFTYFESGIVFLCLSGCQQFIYLFPQSEGYVKVDTLQKVVFFHIDNYDIILKLALN